MSYLHMIIHAFFKRMLFLRTGSLMGQMGGLQDSRFYGASVFSFSSVLFFLVSCFCLGGFPFFLGFYSKDFIISSVSYGQGYLFYFLFLVGCLFTVSYRFRLMFRAYLLMYNYNFYISFMERLEFFLSVMFLFFKCWVLGGFIYWAFLSHIMFFFTFFDLFVGIVIFVGGIFLFFLLKFLYMIFFRLAGILFLR